MANAAEGLSSALEFRIAAGESFVSTGCAAIAGLSGMAAVLPSIGDADWIGGAGLHQRLRLARIADHLRDGRISVMFSPTAPTITPSHTKVTAMRGTS